jgi:hypothetical protein
MTAHIDGAGIQLTLPSEEIDLRRIRLTVLLILPLTSGLLMAMGMAMGTAKEPDHEQRLGGWRR